MLFVSKVKELNNPQRKNTIKQPITPTIKDIFHDRLFKIYATTF